MSTKLSIQVLSVSRPAKSEVEFLYNTELDHRCRNDAAAKSP